MIILINKKRAAIVIFVILIAVSMVLLYKPYLRKFEYPLKYSNEVNMSAERFGVDPLLIYSIIKAESKFDEEALSGKGAQGLMQITPETAEWAMEKIGIDKSLDIFSPEVNITIGSWYIKKLLGDHDGNLTAALASYNAGSTNVNKWKNEDGGLTAENIRFDETYDYVNKTIEFYDNYKKLYRKGEVR